MSVYNAQMPQTAAVAALACLQALSPYEQERFLATLRAQDPVVHFLVEKATHEPVRKSHP